MEGRMASKYRQVSPERTIVWTERSPKYQQVRRVPVVYYLCRNRQLEHPHFIEVPLPSTEGLYLRDVINRLNVLRGRGMPSLYSWSCKRSYKNGFVWHDLCEDDLILPAHGNEYVLKGSELYDESSSGVLSPHRKVITSNLKQLTEPISSRSLDDSSSSSSLNGKEGKHNQEDEASPPLQHPESFRVSPEYRLANTSPSNGSLSLADYKDSRRDNSADASTQTEENVGRPKSQETCVRGVSTDDIYCEAECNDRCNQVQGSKENSNICTDSVSPPPSSSSASSSGGRNTETLESLIRADASKINSFRMIEEEEMKTPSAKVKPANVLMQLISCGSISVKDHSFGLIPNYRPRVSHSKFPSPLFSTSALMFGDLDGLSGNPKLTGLRFEDKEYFSGSLIDAKGLMEGRNECTALKRSSSYNADRTSRQMDSPQEKVESTSAHSKCIPRSIKASLSRQPRSESMRSPASDGPRNSADGVVGSQRSTTPPVSNGSSKRMSEPSPVHPSSKRLDSFREDENVIKFEES